MRASRLFMPFLAAMLLPACASPPDSVPQPPPTAQLPPLDMVARSDLRERAVALLERAARGPDPLLRANAIEGLLLAPARLRPPLALALTDENQGVRAVAAMALAEAGASGASLCDLAPSVRPLLRDPAARVRAAAIYALLSCGQPVNPTPLADNLTADPDPRVRSQAAFILGELGDRSAIPLLRSALARGLPRADTSELLLFELQVAEALAKLGDEDQLQVLRAALYPARPDDLEAAALAAQILGEVGDRASSDQLILLTAYRQGGTLYPAEVRLAAAQSLAKLGNPRGTFIADEYHDSEIPAVRSQAAHLYGHAADPTRLRVLEQMLEDPEGIVQVAAAAAIVRLTS